jgi:hypothetical protein
MFDHTRLKMAAIMIGLACATSGASAAAERIYWSTLRPANQPGRTVQSPDIAPLSNPDTLAWRDDVRMVQLTGFILPIDREGDLVYEFMLVPWAGACSHGASPPPNQLVHVFPEEPFRLSVIYEAVTITGSLRPGQDKAQLFILDGTRVLTYGYSMRGAEVAKATKLNDPDVRAIPPGSFLSR